MNYGVTWSKWHQVVDCPWVVMCDFNQWVSQEEKNSGTRRNGHPIGRFGELIDKCEWVDMGFHGPRFTWTNSRKGHAKIRERLDRILVNVPGELYLRMLRYTTFLELTQIITPF